MNESEIFYFVKLKRLTIGANYSLKSQCYLISVTTGMETKWMLLNYIQNPFIYQILEPSH